MTFGDTHPGAFLSHRTASGAEEKVIPTLQETDQTRSKSKDQIPRLHGAIEEKKDTVLAFASRGKETYTKELQ